MVFLPLVDVDVFDVYTQADTPTCRTRAARLWQVDGGGARSGRDMRARGEPEGAARWRCAPY